MPLVDRHPQLTRPDGSPLRVLVVDDEPNIAELLRMALRYEGWDVEVALTGSKAVSTAKATKPRRRRARHDAAGLRRHGGAAAGCAPSAPTYPSCSSPPATPSRTASPGLTAGGDDYVTKPFSLEEVVARLRGLMRRSGASDRTAEQRADGRRPDARRGQPRGPPRRRGDRLTATEFELLRYLMRNPRRVLSQGADPRPRLELRLRRPGQRRRALHLLPAQEDRRRPGADDPHDARRRVRPEADGLSRRCVYPPSPSPSPAGWSRPRSRWWRW